mgnify:FL=1
MINFQALPEKLRLEITKEDLEQFALDIVQKALNAQSPLTAPAKTILTMPEASELTGLARQTLYAMTSQRIIPHFKRGKRVLFRREELEQWMMENRRQTLQELNSNLKNLKK